MRAVVMASGEGSRLRPLTSGRSYRLVPVANRPIVRHVGCADDDTSSTPQNGMANAPMMVNQASVHRPKSTAQCAAVPLSPSDVNVTLQPGQGFSGTKYSLYLYDQSGQLMPGVWVQERYTSVPNGVLSIYVNSDSVYWTSRMPDSNSPWNTYPSGVFMYDYTWLTYDTSTFTSATAVHHYWAATKAISTTVPGGIDVGTWTISYGTATTTQSLNP